MKSTSRRRVSSHERREERDILAVSLSAPGTLALQVPQTPSEDHAHNKEQEPGILTQRRAPQGDWNRDGKYGNSDQRDDERPLALLPAWGRADEEPGLQPEHKARQAEQAQVRGIDDHCRRQT